MTCKDFLAGAAFALAFAMPASATETAWTDISTAIFGGDYMTPAGDLIAIDAPYRSKLDSRTRIGATVSAPPGAMLASVSVILDENPMPVSAVFHLETPMARFAFDLTMRVNGPTPLHLVARTTDGQLLVAETFVKTSGQGACSAPPGTDPAEALADLGRMTVAVADTPAWSLTDRIGDQPLKTVDIGIRHPSHSGLQMDQISLLFIPSRYIETLQVEADGIPFATMTGSISLSENPHLTLSAPQDTRSVAVTLTDTSGTVTRAEGAIVGY